MTGRVVSALRPTRALRPWRVRTSLLPLLLPLLLASVPPARAASVDFTADERAAILAHGPWPPARTRDAGNRVDGDPDAIALGRRLFADRRLSASGAMACTTCHDPRRAFQDGRRAARHGRNTTGLLDAGHQRWFRWDGAADSLWAASLTPLLDADEIGATPAGLRALLRRDRELDARYRRLFGEPADDASLPVGVAKALAAYQATLVSPRTAFDAFRDALERGDAAAASRYPAAAQRGLKIFVGQGRCNLCHVGPAFTNGEFADIGRPFFASGGADPGRWGGLKQLMASPYNRLGAYSDAPADGPDAVATRHVLMEPRNFGEFKVPGLRGLTATAPYFHDGSAPTLEAAIRHYDRIDENRLHADGARLLRPLGLSARDGADLAAFLRSLSTPEAARRAGETRPRGR